MSDPIPFGYSGASNSVHCLDPLCTNTIGLYGNDPPCACLCDPCTAIKRHAEREWEAVLYRADKWPEIHDMYMRQRVLVAAVREWRSQIVPETKVELELARALEILNRLSV